MQFISPICSISPFEYGMPFIKTIVMKQWHYLVLTSVVKFFYFFSNTGLTMCDILFGDETLIQDGTNSGVLIVTITIPMRSVLLSVSIFQCLLFASFYSLSFSFMSSPYMILYQECRYRFKSCDDHNTVNRNLADIMQCKFLNI